MMQNFNVSNADNLTCLNETCATQLSQTADLKKWGLLTLILVIFCTALGNLLVCLAVCWDRRLQNMTNYFLMSLAIADFLVSIIVMPFGMVVEIYGYFPLEAEFCAFWVTMDVLMCTASIWHMCTMSMDRYFTLKYPMQYGRNKTKTMVAIKIVFVWAVSITISSPICIYGLVDKTYVFNDNTCVITLEEFAIYGSIFAFYIPLCIMILTYLLTIRILWQNQNMMRSIDRSDFRMRPRHSFPLGKACHVTTMVSPPSSDSRRESHTEISSLGRTPNRERVNLPGTDPSDMQLIEMKSVIDNAYLNSNCSTMSNHITHNAEMSFTNHNEKDNDEETSTKYKGADGNDTNAECENRSYMEIPQQGQIGLSTTQVLIQSPSEDEVDEYSDLLSTSHKKVSNSNRTSKKLSRFRNRTNTEIPSTYCSLKIPKTSDKQNLQASVSCSNFSENTEKDVLVSMGLHGGLMNRDYKSLEWCQHFYEIQEEMNQCLRESRKEKFLKKKSSTCSNIDPKSQNSSNDYGIAASVKKDELKPSSQISVDISESGDSLDDVDSSSENTSDVLTIKLYPKSVYMYKLDVPTKSKLKHSQDIKQKDSNSIITNGVIKNGGKFVRDYSLDSDKGEKNDHKVVRKRSSIRNFIRQCKKKNGFKHFTSSKTTTNERKASKVLGIIFAVFVVLWTPFFTANIVMAVCHTCLQYITPEIMSAFVWMGYVASLANPIIYTMFNTAFRHAFIKILSCHMCKQERRGFHRPSLASYRASVYTDRRQTLTVLLNGNNQHENRIGSDLGSNHSYGR